MREAMRSVITAERDIVTIIIAGMCAVKPKTDASDRHGALGFQSCVRGAQEVCKHAGAHALFVCGFACRNARTDVILKLCMDACLYVWTCA